MSSMIDNARERMKIPSVLMKMDEQLVSNTRMPLGARNPLPIVSGLMVAAQFSLAFDASAPHDLTCQDRQRQQEFWQARLHYKRQTLLKNWPRALTPQ